MIHIGIIGLGHWGPNHLRVFNSLSRSRVVAVSDLDAARRKRALSGNPGCEEFGDAAQLLARENIHAVVICTPTATHYPLVKAALLAGKHVFCEKPLCLTFAESTELTELAEKQQRVLMVGHIFLFNAGLIRIKALIDSGEMGRVLCLSAIRTNLGPIRSDVNASYDLASHDLSIFNWLLGAEPEATTAMGAAFLQPGIEDVVNISLRYPGNVLGSIHCSWLDPKKVRQITVVGEKKMATWDDMNLASPVAIYEKGAKSDLDVADYSQFLRVSMWEGDVRLPKIPQGEPLKSQAESFLSTILDGSPNPSCGKFSSGVVRALEQIEQALQPARSAQASSTNRS